MPLFFFRRCPSSPAGVGVPGGRGTAGGVVWVLAVSVFVGKDAERLWCVGVVNGMNELPEIVTA